MPPRRAGASATPRREVARTRSPALDAEARRVCRRDLDECFWRRRLQRLRPAGLGRRAEVMNHASCRQHKRIVGIHRLVRRTVMCGFKECSSLWVVGAVMFGVDLAACDEIMPVGFTHVRIGRKYMVRTEAPRTLRVSFV